VGLSFQNLEQGNKPSLRSTVEFNIPLVIVTTVTLILALLVVIPLRQSERSAWKLNIQFDPKNQQQTEIFNSSVTQVLIGKFTPTEYKNLAAVNLLRIDQKDKALQILNDTLNSDPRNLDTLAVLVDLNEKNGNYNSAIYYRKQIAKYDPWNAQNYLGLAQLYKVTNDLINMKVMVDKILSFASSDPIAEVAKKEFIQNSN
jgi:tetratricopeptide (TPR) repeat protein